MAAEEENDINNKNNACDIQEEKGYKEKYIRLLAEFDNYKKFREREYETMKNVACKNLASDLVPVLEALEMGAKAGDKNAEIILNKLSKTLSRHGLEKISVEKGDDFNHDIHDAVMYCGHDLEEGKIIDIASNGYTLNGMIIKHPQVIVSKGADANQK